MFSVARCEVLAQVGPRNMYFATHISGGEFHDGAGAGGPPAGGQRAPECRVDDARLAQRHVVGIPRILKSATETQHKSHLLIMTNKYFFISVEKYLHVNSLCI
jgi:hypothetical protein